MVNVTEDVLAVKFKVALLLGILLYSKFETFRRDKGRVSELKQKKTDSMKLDEFVAKSQSFMLGNIYGKWSFHEEVHNAVEGGKCRGGEEGQQTNTVEQTNAVKQGHVFGINLIQIFTMARIFRRKSIVCLQ